MLQDTVEAVPNLRPALYKQALVSIAVYRRSLETFSGQGPYKETEQV